MGSDLLVRAVFHGQADVTALLEVTLITQLDQMLCMCLLPRGRAWDGQRNWGFSMLRLCLLLVLIQPESKQVMSVQSLILCKQWPGALLRVL